LGEANRAFVNAITTGFRISALILVATLLISLALLTRRMRAAQAGREAELDRVFPSDSIEEWAPAVEAGPL
jgi:uncharacterized membrane protein YhaH (DUF805 family)